MRFQIIDPVSTHGRKVIDRFFGNLGNRSVDEDVTVVDADNATVEAPDGWTLKGYGPLTAIPANQAAT